MPRSPAPGAFLALLLPALALLGAGAGAACADDLPEGTARVVGYPPLRPLHARGPEALEAWCGAVAARGRALRGTRAGGDLLAAAAQVLAGDLHRPGDADVLFAAGAAAYPPDDPSIGLLLLAWVEHAARRGHAPQVGRLLDQLRPWAAARPGVDLDAPSEVRWRWLAEGVAARLPRVAATWHAQHGRFGDAAASLAALADPREDDAARSLRWERVARWRWRAGDREAAAEAIDEALAAQPDDALRVALGFWRLQARHDLLDAQAAPTLTARWPGEAYERDARAWLREVQGLPGVAPRHLALASGALAAGRLETALDLYRMALGDPGIVAAARHDELVWRGLLPACEAALALGRFDEAERLLEAVERIADEAIPEKDALLVRIRKGRARREAPQAPQAPAPPADGAEVPARRRAPAGIETGEGRAPDAPPGEGPGDASTDRRRPRIPRLRPGLQALCLAVMLLAAGLGLRAARGLRRSRRRRPPGA